MGGQDDGLINCPKKIAAAEAGLPHSKAPAAHCVGARVLLITVA